MISETALELLAYIAAPLAVMSLPLFIYLAAPSAGMGGFLTRLIKLIEGVNGRIGAGVKWLALFMAVVQFAIVILRYVFGISFIWMQESVTYMHGALFLLLGGYVLMTDDHVRVDVFYREASPQRKAQVNLFGALFLLAPMCLLTLMMSGPYVAASWATLEGSNETSGIQAVFLLKTLIPIFAGLLLAQAFALAARSVLLLKGAPVPDGPEPEGGAGV